MKSAITSWIAVLFLLPLLVLGSGGLQLVPEAHGEQHAMAAPEASECLSLCTSRAQAPEVLPGQKDKEADSEPKLRPAENYYLQFASLTAVVAPVTAASLLKHLRWRPPDLFKLFSNFRI